MRAVTYGSFRTTTCNPGISAKSLAFEVSSREVTLDRLRRKPEVVYAHVWIAPGFLELCGKRSKCLRRFNGDSQLRLSTESAEHRRGALLLRTGSQHLHAEPNFGDVHR